MKKASSAEVANSGVAALEGEARQRGAATGKSTLSDRSSAATPATGLWLWVGAAFLLLILAWAALFTVARSAKIEAVPLTTQGGGTR